MIIFINNIKLFNTDNTINNNYIVLITSFFANINKNIKI